MLWNAQDITDTELVSSNLHLSLQSTIFYLVFFSCWQKKQKQNFTTADTEEMSWSYHANKTKAVSRGSRQEADFFLTKVRLRRWITKPSKRVHITQSHWQTSFTLRVPQTQAELGDPAVLPDRSPVATVARFSLQHSPASISSPMLHCLT